VIDPERFSPRAAGIVLAALLLASAPAPGEEVRLPATRDAWFSDVGPEADGSNGAAPRLKLKSYQEMSLIDVEPAAMKGRVVVGATLHLKSTGPPILRKVTVGTFGAEWSEGTATGYQPLAGASTFRSRNHPGVPWTIPGGDLSEVILGQGGTTWRNADATPPDVQGWQRVAVGPVVVAARVAGVSHGFLLFDDTGSEWTRKGNRFTAEHMPNRFLYSRDQNASSAPYLTVELGPEDRSPPPTPTAPASDDSGRPAGEALVTWETPPDVGPAGTVGFFVRVDGRDVPRYLIPMAGRAGERVRMHLRDLGLAPGSRVGLEVRAVDGAGNIGPGARFDVRVSGLSAKPLPGSVPAVVGSGKAPAPRLGGASIAVVDELDKRDPTSGALVPDGGAGYLAANHLWDAGARRITLQAARNEFVGFQVLILGPARGIRPALTFEGAGAAGLKVEFGRLENVGTKRGPMPDPVVPLVGPFDSSGTGMAGGSLYVEVYVTHDAPAGEIRGTLSLRAGPDEIKLEVALRVWDFALPDGLSFLPEMNAYDLPENERDFYRMAQRHRTVINRVPYSQTGAIRTGMAPRPTRDGFDWSDWDRRFGPYLDGSAFAGLPRKGVPIEVFYLPLHENWPTPIEGNYNGDYWADRAFPDSYRRAFVEASRRFAEHLGARGWRETIFLGFLNNKVDFKAGDRGWSGGSSPWLLDEPASFQDFWALRYFASAFHEGVAAARLAGPGKAKIAFRADISRPQWQRDSLDGLLDYNVVGSEVRSRPRLVLDRKEAQGQFVLEYGGSNPIEESNVQPAAWCVDAWTLGVDGVIPWQTIGRAESWRQGDELSLFYPGRTPDEPGPVPSIRLKAYRRGQQDVEYLTLLALVRGEPRWAVGGRVREALRLAGERLGAGPEAADAGSIRFGSLLPRDLWALRVRVGQTLSDAKPAPRRKSVDWTPPPRDPSAAVPPGPSTGGPADPRG